MTLDLQLRGLDACAQEAYLRDVRQLAAFYRPTPNQFNEEQQREYFLRLKNHRQISLLHTQRHGRVNAHRTAARQVAGRQRCH